MIIVILCCVLLYPLVHSTIRAWHEYILLQDMLTKRKPKGRAGYVYFVAHNTMLHTIKIGRAVNITNRVKDFDTFAPHGVWLITSIRCRNASFIETYLHHRFSYLRAKGEWFHVDFVLFMLILFIRFRL